MSLAEVLKFSGIPVFYPTDATSPVPDLTHTCEVATHTHEYRYWHPTGTGIPCTAHVWLQPI